MIIVNKNNFSVQTMEKRHDSASAPKNTFYADFKVCLALEGEAVWEIEDRSYEIRPGDVVFLNIGQKRHFTAFGETGFRLCVFTLKRSAFQNMHHFMFLLDRAGYQKNLIRQNALSPLLKEIYDEWAADAPFAYELASAKLTEFFIKAERQTQYAHSPSGKIDREMLELTDYIDANIANGISLAAAAKKAGMTQSAFSRRFSAINGISFKAYIVERKIERAIFLLRNTNRKMIDIAQDSGFDSISGFYCAFKKKTGTTRVNFPRSIFEQKKRGFHLAFLSVCFTQAQSPGIRA